MSSNINWTWLKIYETAYDAFWRIVKYYAIGCGIILGSALVFGLALQNGKNNPYLLLPEAFVKACVYYLAPALAFIYACAFYALYILVIHDPARYLYRRFINKHEEQV